MSPATLLALGRGVGSLATLLIPIALARVFDPHDFGTYKQLSLVYTTLYLLAPLGMAESLYYFIPRSRELAGAHVANALVFLALTGGASAILLVLGSDALVAALNNPELRGYGASLGAFAALTVLASLLEIVMVSRGHFGQAAASYAASDVLRTLAFVAPALLARRLDWVFWGAAGFSAVRVLAASGWALREFGSALRPNGPAFYRQLAYAAPFGCAGLLEVAQASFHQYAVAHAFDAAAFAVYSVGCLQVPLVDLIAGSAGNVLMVRIGESHQDLASARRLWFDTTTNLALILIPLFGLLAAVAHDMIVLLYTDRYAAAAPIFRVFSVSLLLGALQTDAVLRARGETGFLLRLGILKLGLVAALVLPCLQAFQLIGGAVATAAGLLVAKAVALARVQRSLGLPLGALLPWRVLAQTALASGTAVAVALACRAAVAGGTFRMLVVTAAAYAACCGLLVGIGRLGAISSRKSACVELPAS